MYCLIILNDMTRYIFNDFALLEEDLVFVGVFRMLWIALVIDKHLWVKWGKRKIWLLAYLKHNSWLLLNSLINKGASV